MVMVCGGIFALAHYGRVMLGGLILSIIGIFFLSVASMPTTILYGPSGVAYIIPILIAGMVVGQYGVVLCWALSLAALALLASQFGVEGGISGYMSGIIITVSSALLWLTIRSMQRLVVYAEGQKELAEQARTEVVAQKQSLATSYHELEQSNAELERLVSVVRDLETPVIPVLQGVLVVPLVGHFDARRASELNATVLAAVHGQRARTVLIDITGVAIMNVAVGQHLLQLAQAIRLLGAQIILTGIQASMAPVLVELGSSFTGIKTAHRLEDGIAAVLQAH
jgi:anti-anti-sigma regulatory factor